jgi:hypothetical protein
MPKASVPSSAQPGSSPVCRIRQEDKVFNDVLAFKIPVHDDKHGPARDCPTLIDAELPALKATRTIPILDVGFIRLAAAAQWVLAHPEVTQCLQKVDAPNFVLSRFLGRADGTQGPTIVLVRNCDKQIFFVTNAVVPPATLACGQVHIPDCPVETP